MRRVSVVAASLGLALLAAPARARDAAPRLCGWRPAPPPVWEHVVGIWFENHGFEAIIGARNTPNINRKISRSCGVATNYHSLTHPSTPNYIAATSGQPLAALGALRADCNATGPCQTAAPSLFAQAPSWGA